MVDLAELERRLEAATGPDRELDESIAMALGLAEAFFSKHRYWCVSYQGEHWISGTYPNFHPDTGKKNVVPAEPHGWGWDVSLPEYTASLDAALALVEEKLPGWEWRVMWNGCQGNLAELTDNETAESSMENFSGLGATPALGLLLALIRALRESEAADG